MKNERELLLWKVFIFHNYIESDFRLFYCLQFQQVYPPGETAGEQHLERKMLNKFNNRINKCNWTKVLFVYVRKGKTGTNRVSGCQVGSLLGQRPLLAFKRNESCGDKVWIMIFLFKESEQFRTRRAISLMSLLVLRLALYFFFIHSLFFFCPTC